MIKYVIFGLLLTNSSYSRDLLPIPTNLLNAIAQIESNNNDLAVGDNGKSISRYQIQRNCYLDAKEYDKTITFPYGSLTNKVNAEKIIKAYFNRYGRNLIQTNDYESLARLFNSGPNWENKKHLTENYVKKFRAALKKI